MSTNRRARLCWPANSDEAPAAAGFWPERWPEAARPQLARWPEAAQLAAEVARANLAVGLESLPSVRPQLARLPRLPRHLPLRRWPWPHPPRCLQLARGLRMTMACCPWA